MLGGENVEFHHPYIHVRIPTYCDLPLSFSYANSENKQLPFTLPTLPSRKLRPGNKITLTIVETFPPTKMNFEKIVGSRPMVSTNNLPNQPLQVTDVRNVSVVEIKLSKDFSRQEMWCFSRIFERFLNVEEFSKKS